MLTSHSGLPEASMMMGGGALAAPLIQAMAEGVVVQDEYGRIIDCNPAAEAILG